MKKFFQISNNKILLKFQYNKEQIQKIKEVKGWEFNSKTGCWILPYTEENLIKIQEWNFQSFKKQQKIKRIAYIHKHNIEITKENKHPKLNLKFWSRISGISGKISIDRNKDSQFLPRNPLVDTILRENGFEFEEVKEKIDLETFKLPEEIVKYESKSGYNFTHYQLEAIEFIYKKAGRALIGDEMGLGKTIEALGYLLSNPSLRPALIICKASAKLNWLKECSEWIPNKFSRILSKGKGNEISPLFSIYIINYDILGKRLNQILKEMKPKIIISDECQTIKNQDAQRTRAFQALCKGTSEEKETQNFHFDRKYLEILPMSGTPIVNRPEEFFTILNILNPSEFPTYEWYKKRYCFQANSFFDKRVKKDRLFELNEEVSKIMIRRLKKDVMKELPDKIRTSVVLELDNRKEYKRAENEFIAWVKENFGKKAADAATRAEQLVFINRMKMLAAQGKLKALIQWIDDFLESDEKLVIFCTHKFMIAKLEEKYRERCVKLVGGMKIEDKQEAVDRFQNEEEVKLFLGNLKAAGDSITLTSSSSVLFAEFGWTPGEHVQAEDRCHRIGQKDTVNCYYMIAENTIEEYLVTLISEKMKDLGKILDGVEVMEEDLLSGLSRIYWENLR